MDGFAWRMVGNCLLGDTGVAGKPMLLIALICFLHWARTQIICGSLALLFAMLTFELFSRSSLDDRWGSLKLVGFGSGFYFWVVSIAILLFAAWMPIPVSKEMHFFNIAAPGYNLLAINTFQCIPPHICAFTPSLDDRRHEFLHNRDQNQQGKQGISGIPQKSPTR